MVGRAGRSRVLGRHEARRPAPRQPQRRHVLVGAGRDARGDGPGGLRRPAQHARVRPARAHPLPPVGLQAVQPSRGVRLRGRDPPAGASGARRGAAAGGRRTARLRRVDRQAAADADARPPARRSRLRRAVVGRAWRRAARQLRSGFHRPPGRPHRYRRVQGDPVPVPRRPRPVPLRREPGRGATGAPDRRRDHRSAGADDRRRPADRTRVQELLRAPGRRRQRHHAVHDHGRHQGPHRTSRSTRRAARRDRSRR